MKVNLGVLVLLYIVLVVVNQMVKHQVALPLLGIFMNLTVMVTANGEALAV